MDKTYRTKAETKKKYEGVQTYIEYYHQKKHQGIGMKPNDAHYKTLKQNAA